MLIACCAREMLPMAFRFRRSIKVAPGVRLNLNKGGMSVSAGVRGASVTAGSRGVHANVGIPGTGLSARQKLSGASSRRSRTSSSAAAGPVDVQFALKDDGSVQLTGADGRPLPEAVQRRAKREARETVEAWLIQHCAHWNQGIEKILSIHHSTPAPAPSADFQRTPYSTPRPASPRKVSLKLLDRLIRSRRERAESSNRAAEGRFQRALETWQESKREHEAAEELMGARFETAQAGDPEAATEVLEKHVRTLDWPRETLISFEVGEDSTVWLDVDLPEIEDLPTETAVVAKRGLKINVKTKSAAALRREYMTHVHGILFRLVGEVFHLLPSLNRVVASGYSQRPDPGTGQIRDDYLLSVCIERGSWEGLNFGNIGAIDLPTCLDGFNLRRKMTKTGIFKPIDPFDPAEPFDQLNASAGRTSSNA